MERLWHRHLNEQSLQKRVCESTQLQHFSAFSGNNIVDIHIVDAWIKMQLFKVR
jgi:hypothetical protein